MWNRVKTIFFPSKVVEQKMVQLLTSHAFFHLPSTMEYRIASVPQRAMINFGVLLRSMPTDTMWMGNGETVTATVGKVKSSHLHSMARARDEWIPFFSYIRIPWILEYHGYLDTMDS